MASAENIKAELKEQVNSVLDIIQDFYVSYKEKSSLKLRVLDSFIIYNFFILILQICYMVIVGNFPKNSFLSGIICCIGTMALTGKRFFVIYI